MIHLDKLDGDIERDIACNLGYGDDKDDPKPYQYYQQQIAQMDVAEAWERWCAWNGLAVWHRTLRRVLDAIRAAEVVMR